MDYARYESPSEMFHSLIFLFCYSNASNHHFDPYYKLVIRKYGILNLVCTIFLKNPI